MTEYSIKSYVDDNGKEFIKDNTIILLINGGDKKSQVKDIKLAKEIIDYLKLKG